MSCLTRFVSDSVPKTKASCWSPRFRLQNFVAAIIRMVIHGEKWTAKTFVGSARNLASFNAWTLGDGQAKARIGSAFTIVVVRGHAAPPIASNCPAMAGCSSRRRKTRFCGY